MNLPSEGPPHRGDVHLVVGLEPELPVEWVVTLQRCGDCGALAIGAVSRGLAATLDTAYQEALAVGMNWKRG